MMRISVGLLSGTPAFAAIESGHSGTVHPRTRPEPSDIALFAFAVLAVWLVRRALRARFKRRD